MVRAAHDANRIITVVLDQESNTLTITTVARPDGHVLDLPGDVLGRQMLDAVHAQIPVAGQGGSWDSAETVTTRVRRLRRVHSAWSAEGRDFSEADLDAWAFLALVERFGRTVLLCRTAFVTALQRHHPESGPVIRALRAMHNQPTPVGRAAVALDEKVVRELENQARQTLIEADRRLDRLIRGSGFLGDWRTAPPEDVLAAIPWPTRHADRRLVPTEGSSTLPPCSSSLTRTAG